MSTMALRRRDQIGALSSRSVLSLVRQPSLVVPSLVFPLFFVALGTASFARAINIPGFPEVDSFLDFALAGSVVQGVLFGSVTSAAALATDIETGFFDRLLVHHNPSLFPLVIVKEHFSRHSELARNFRFQGSLFVGFFPIGLSCHCLVLRLVGW